MTMMTMTKQSINCHQIQSCHVRFIYHQAQLVSLAYDLN